MVVLSSQRRTGAPLPLRRIGTGAICLTLLTAFGFMVLLASFTRTAHAAPFADRDVKAAFMVKFTKFVEWPDSAFEGEDAPFVIGILGEDPFGPIVDELAKDETYGARRMEVRRSKDIEELKVCQLLYMGVSKSAEEEETLKALKELPVLTVGESDGFARRCFRTGIKV